MNKMIYHIVSASDWNIAKRGDHYQPSQFATDGFIHCSYLHQLPVVANRFYRGQNNLVLLAIDRHKITSEIVDENLEGGRELYPHLYGALPINAVSQVIAFPCKSDGSFCLPEKLKD